MQNSRICECTLDGALADHNQSVALDPRCAEDCSNRAIAWKAKGRSEEAMSDYSGSMEQDPRNVEASAH